MAQHARVRTLLVGVFVLLSSDERRGTGDLEWNYVKFLVGRDGVPVKRFGSLYNPKDFEGDVSD